MILGENGVAYLNYGGGATAFNIADGTSLWDYASPCDCTTHLVNAISGGGLIINDPTLGLISLDASGNATMTGTIATTPSPWSLGNWVGVVGDPLMAMFVGPSLNSTLLALSDFPMLHGNRQATSAAPKMIMSVFIPVAPGATGDPLFGTTAAAGAHITSALSQSPVDLRLFISTGSDQATAQKFIDNVASPLDVVAFIGHGDLRPNGTGLMSVGLFFTDIEIVLTQFRNNNTQRPVDKINTAAKIIFVGSCDTSTEFLSLWDINSTNGGRALVVPDLTEMARLNPNFTEITQQEVDLVQATFVLEQIAIGLSRGDAIQKAVTDANAFVRTKYDGNPGMQTNPLAQWTVAPGGDTNARTKPQN
jgi:hypothetical protein